VTLAQRHTLQLQEGESSGADGAAVRAGTGQVLTGWRAAERGETVLERCAGRQGRHVADPDASWPPPAADSMMQVSAGRSWMRGFARSESVERVPVARLAPPPPFFFFFFFCGFQVWVALADSEGRGSWTVACEQSTGSSDRVVRAVGCHGRSVEIRFNTQAAHRCTALPI